MDSYRDFHPDAVVQQENRLDSTSGEIVLIILNVFIDNRELFTKLWLKGVYPNTVP